MKAALLCIAQIFLCCLAAQAQGSNTTAPPAIKTGKAAALALPPEKANPVKAVLFATPPVID